MQTFQNVTHNSFFSSLFTIVFILISSMVSPLVIIGSAIAVSALDSTLINYSPYEANCPISNSTFLNSNLTQSGFIRDNFGISQEEYSWIAGRQVKTHENLIDFLDGLNMSDYSKVTFADYLGDLNQSTINIGLSFSGGGFRALLTGAGELSALDSRSLNSSVLSGLLDSSAYISGLSGGSIMLSTLVNQNWTSVDEIIYGNSTLWNMTGSPFPSSIPEFQKLLSEVQPKKINGYDISLVDIFGRILSRYMFEEEQSKYGLDALWSDIQYSDPFVNYDMPFPMILTTGGGSLNTKYYSSNVFEVNPFEFGSWSSYVGGFVPLELLGSLLNDGIPENKTSCTFDFDNVGFLVGSSSNILAPFQSTLNGVLEGKINISDIDFSALGLDIDASSLTLSPTTLRLLVNLINPDFEEITYGILDNPFYNFTGVANITSDIVDEESLFMVDGGLFDEVIPMDPFLVPGREVDIVFAFDNSANTENNWPNGTTLFATEERWLESFPNDTFYELPASAEEFVELGLNLGPVFFGCNGSELITDELTHPGAIANFTFMKPLLVYVPNTNLTAMSNVTGYTYTNEERNALVGNGFELLQGDNEDFAQCVGCAIIRRSEERLGLSPSPNCAKCFDTYCYVPPHFEDSFNVTVPVVSESRPTSLYSASSLPSSLVHWRSTKSAFIASERSVAATATGESISTSSTVTTGTKTKQTRRVKNNANTTVTAATETK